jgi:hypothetical protein
MYTGLLVSYQTFVVKTLIPYPHPHPAPEPAPNPISYSNQKGMIIKMKNLVQVQV